MRQWKQPHDGQAVIVSVFTGWGRLYQISTHSDHVCVCGNEVSSYMMRFLATFELMVMSFIPAVVRFSGDNEVSTSSGEVGWGFSLIALVEQTQFALKPARWYGRFNHTQTWNGRHKTHDILSTTEHVWMCRVCSICEELAWSLARVSMLESVFQVLWWNIVKYYFSKLSIR